MIQHFLARVGPAAALSLLVVLSGCSPHEPLIPEEVHQLVSDEGRMRTFDVAWQNTRMLNETIHGGDLTHLTDDAIIITSRMHRLETAKAGPMNDRRTARALTTARELVDARNASANLEALSVVAQELQDDFDAGNFGAAKAHALEILAIAQWLEDTK